MKLSLLLFLPFAPASCLLAQGPETLSPALGSLLANSPFGQPAAEASPGATPAGPLEWRSVVVADREVSFSIFSYASRSSRWVGLKEPGNPFTVISYDDVKNEIQVNFQGRMLTLALKQATIIALAGTPDPAPSGGPQAPLASSTTNDEGVRLAQIAAEIVRRRALRQRAEQQSNPGQTPAPTP